jgi:Flp pilus assembly CpaF family ATPase
MNNLNIFQSYKQDILDIFKENYKKCVSQNPLVNFDSVLLMTLKELKLQTYDKNQIGFLEEWFQLIHNQSFFTYINKSQNFNEVIFHGPHDVQIIEGGLRSALSLDVILEEDYQLSLEVFALKNNAIWNYSDPFVSFQTTVFDLPCRVTLIHHSTSATSKSKVFIRTLFTSPLSLDKFNCAPELSSFMKNIIQNKKNILIAGSTGCGKTTLLRSLLEEADSNEHVIILEDTHEIFSSSPKHTSFLSKDKNGKKSLKEYCAYALRMSPDRLVLGEMRSDEVVPFLLAMNTGHNGLLSTIHANSSMDAISRLALLFSMYSGNKDMSFELITKLICKNIDYVIYLKDKVVTEVCKVVGSENDVPYFEKIY